MTRRLAAGDSSMAVPSFFSKYALDLRSPNFHGKNFLVTAIARCYNTLKA
ncbi:MAG: hypothetical protein LUK37_11890 [Clostridia bacterium]|nr:hypothetical protein [Clostridia bacterium]